MDSGRHNGAALEAAEQDRRFTAAIARLDAANAEDPNVEFSDGATLPKEVLYSRRMSAWLDRLAPAAPEPLRLAVRAQHIRRWQIPRSRYPMDRAGYHHWRTDLARFHAEVAGEILTEVGYGQETISRVGALIRKERLKSDPETQTLEDCACLVFLESYLPEFAAQHEDDTLVSILQRTWRKMSVRAQQAALDLPFDPRARALLGTALGEETPAPG